MTVLALPQYMFYAAWDVVNQQFVSGDLANHTLQIAIDGAAAKTPDNTPVAAGLGVYRVELSNAERVGEQVALSGTSSTANIIIQPITNAADARLAGMTYPSTDTPTVASYTQDAHDILYQHVSDASASVISHGDTTGGWGNIADVTGLATSQNITDLQTHGDTNWSTANISSLALETSVQLVLTTGSTGPWTTGTGGGGESDWTDTEKNQIRNRLGIDGTTAVPVATPTLALEASVQTVITTGNQNWLTFDDADLRTYGDTNWSTWDSTAQIVDGNVVQWNGVTEPVNEWAKQVESIKSGVLIDGTTVPSGTEFSTNLTEAATDYWKNRSVIMITGALKLQASVITGYTLSGGKGILTIAGFTGAPAVGDELLIV